jgi:hypothetical protein
MIRMKVWLSLSLPDLKNWVEAEGKRAHWANSLAPLELKAAILAGFAFLCSLNSDK